MCGIAAIFAYHYASPEVSREELRIVRDSMEKRGPDGCGEWFSPDGRLAMGHRRLAIIDLSEKGNQPMQNRDGSLVVSFNGEIYNYKELRAGLEKKGRVFFSNSDTEILLHLYEEKGESLVHDLRGMFAFVLWDNKKKIMLLVRDPYGIKPLYYADDGWTVRAASQVKALLSSKRVSKIKEPAGIAGFFLTGSVPEPFTLYQEIRTVPAGSFVQVDSLGPSEPKQYFSISQIFEESKVDLKPKDSREVKERVREALLESVRYHFVSDVPVGMFLSSGIDSGTLVGLAKDLGIARLNTLTLAFGEYRGSEQDESEMAGEVARLYGTEHSTRVLTQAEFAGEFEKVLEAMDQPSIDGVNTYFVSKAAAEKGLKVALSGLGSDEIFGGYPSFKDVPRWVSLLAWPSRIPGLGAASRKIISSLRFLLPELSPKAAGLLEYGGDYEKAYFLKRGLFMPWELSSLMDSDTAREGLRRLALFRRMKTAMVPAPQTPFVKVACLEASFYMRNQLLRDADWAGMAHSLEIRVPFVDSFLLKKLAPLMLLGDSLRPSKQLLPQLLSVKLPDRVTQRKKTGFTVPIDRWLQSVPDLDEWKSVAALSGKHCHWSRRWAYTVYQRFKTPCAS